MKILLYATFLALLLVTTKAKSCDPLGIIKDGSVTCPDDYELGAVCSFSCVDGYSLNPPSANETICLTTTAWSTQKPCCLKDCSPDEMIDLVFVLDSSGSIGPANWPLILNFTNNIIRKLNIRRDAANVGVVLFSSQISRDDTIFLNRFADDKTSLIKAVESLPYKDKSTYTGAALSYARTTMFNPTNGDRKKAKNVIIVITDGLSQDDVSSVSQDLRNEGVTIHAIGIKAPYVQLKMSQLKAIAGSNDRLHIVKSGFKGLKKSLASSLGSNICHKECPGPAPTAKQELAPISIVPTCAEPDSPKNGKKDCGSDRRPDEGYLITSTCKYTCDSGYTLVGLSTTTCDYVDGSKTSVAFNPGPPKCEPLCEQLENIENGNVGCPDGNRVGAVCRFSCIKGYSLSPSKITETECLSNTTWSKKNPCCLKNCSPDELMDLVIVLDSSTSVGDEDWTSVKKFIINLIGKLNIRPDAANVGVMSYSSQIDNDNAIFLNRFTNKKDSLINAIERIPFTGGGTYTGNALNYARTTMFNPTNGDRKEAKNVILVMTDGKTFDDDTVISESEILRDEGVITRAIGITAFHHQLDESQLKAIAGSTERLNILKGGFTELSKSLASLLSSHICQSRKCPEVSR